MYFKLDLKSLKLKFKVGILWNFHASFVSLSLNEFSWNLILLGKQGNASSRPWYSISRSWVVLHEQSSVKLDSVENSGALTGDLTIVTIDHHDRDHDHDQPSRSWHVLKQTLGCSRPYITIVTSSFPARDLRKILVFNWFIFGLFWGFICSAFGRYIFGIRAGFRSKFGFWKVEKGVQCCVFWLIWDSLFWIRVFKLVKVMICI